VGWGVGGVERDREGRLLFPLVYACFSSWFFLYWLQELNNLGAVFVSLQEIHIRGPLTTIYFTSVGLKKVEIIEGWSSLKFYFCR